jgi:large subunit ribosomal protein L33
MAKKRKNAIARLVSSANTGHFYTVAVSKKRTTKLELKKLDPVIRKHVLYTEKKIK